MAIRTPPPSMIRAYRTRAREVQAIDLGDGRHLVLEDPPRYVDSQAFDLAFELVPERRAAARRSTNGRGRDRKKQERRKKTSRRKRETASSARSNGDGSAASAPGSERLASAIAARTSGPAPRPPRNQTDVDRAIEETRSQVDRERQGRREGGGAEAGAKPGKGRKACPKCHILSGARATECGSCGHKFVPKGAKR